MSHIHNITAARRKRRCQGLKNDILYKHVILKQLIRNGLLKIPIPNLLHIMLLTWLDSETLLSYSAGQTKMNPDLMLPECGN